MKPKTNFNSGRPRMGEGEILDGPAKDTEGPLPLRALLTRPVVISVANYGIIGLLDIIAESLIPVVWSTSVEFGGLSMSPASIGLWIAMGYGLMSCIFQLVAFPRIIRRFGPRRLFITSILGYFSVYIMFPFENLALRHSSRSMNFATGLFIMLQLSAIAFADVGFGTFAQNLLLHPARSLTGCGSISLDIDVHIRCRPQQAVSRRYEWNRADGGLDSAHGRTCCCRVAFCILVGQQHSGRKLCVCRAACHGVCWAGHRFAASKEPVETY
jgi:hypothetical protein